MEFELHNEAPPSWEVDRVWIVALCAAMLLTGCATFQPGNGRVEPFRMSSVVSEGDAQRRASTRLVIQGLDASEPAALELYQRALQVDPTNPWAYLALARQRAMGPRPAEALSALDQAESLLRAEGSLTPGVDAHVRGLRGLALLGSGDARGRRLLEEAQRMAPDAWGDGRLDAPELR
ncbi:MAG: tetratricopeptide repeat protein [Myxococcota bacterium]|nr:tetratricopeptide repeat protein [Myxococcota bacterium]